LDLGVVNEPRNTQIDTEMNEMMKEYKQIDMIPIERIERAIYLIRGQKVMLDRDLAELYGVETKALKQAVRRNINRFPDDFSFVLDRQEFATLRAQTVTSKTSTKRTNVPSRTKEKADWIWRWKVNHGTHGLTRK